MGQHLKSCQAAVVSSAAGGGAGQPPLSEDAAVRAWLGGDAEQEWTTDHPWVSREFVQRSGAAVVRGVVDGFLPAGSAVNYTGGGLVITLVTRGSCNYSPIYNRLQGGLWLIYAI
jgi:hypothetical protein